MQDMICLAILAGFIVGCIAWAWYCEKFLNQDGASTQVKVTRPGCKPWVFYTTGRDIAEDLATALYWAEVEGK